MGSFVTFWLYIAFIGVLIVSRPSVTTLYLCIGLPVLGCAVIWVIYRQIRREAERVRKQAAENKNSAAAWLAKGNR
jgi:O-antigen/teichoic acid export membrane protein